MQRGAHADLLDAGVAADGTAFRALLDGRSDEARAALREAAGLYRARGRLISSMCRATFTASTFTSPPTRSATFQASRWR